MGFLGFRLGFSVWGWGAGGECIALGSGFSMSLCGFRVWELWSIVWGLGSKGLGSGLSLCFLWQGSWAIATCF